MARYEHLPIYKKSFSLLVKIENSVLNFGKRAKYSIGSDLRNIFRSFLVSIIKINSMVETERKDFSKVMFNQLNETSLLLSVIKELKLFQNRRDYENFISDLSEIEKQLEGWSKTFK